MDKKDRDYRAFFETNNETNNRNERNDDVQEFEKDTQDVQVSSETSKPTYYSYGPFKSGGYTSNEQKNKVIDVQSVEYTDAESEQHDRLRPQTLQESNWTFPKKRSNWKSSFAGFMAGVLVISSLMFASDYFNWFTTASGEVPTIQEHDIPASSSTSGLRNASIQIAQPETVADIAEQSNPAVVLIETYGSSNAMSQDDIFSFFFGSPRNEPKRGERMKTGAGSGFIFEKDGHIITNEHVVSGADEILVTVLGHKEPYKAELLGSDFDLDLAVLKIEGKEDFPVLPFGNSSEMRQGDWLIAIGNPQGFNHTVSVGVLSAIEREIQIPDQATRKTRMYDHLLQTDAAINPGNSGGPLINLKGEVIGINTAVSTQAQGIGFAIPSSTVLQVIDKLKSGEPIPKPYIGVELSNINETWLSELKLDNTNGTIVVSVFANSPAHRSGLMPYDVILKMNGEEVKDTQQFVEKIQSFEIGERVNLTISRNGQLLEKAVTIADRNA